MVCFVASSSIFFHQANDASNEQESTAASNELDGSRLFTELYEELPHKMSQLLSENLSVPLAFTCLLHLANEKQLKIEGTPSLSDLKISHGL